MMGQVEYKELVSGGQQMVVAHAMMTRGTMVALSRGFAKECRIRLERPDDFAGSTPRARPVLRLEVRWLQDGLRRPLWTGDEKPRPRYRPVLVVPWGAMHFVRQMAKEGTWSVHAL